MSSYLSKINPVPAFPSYTGPYEVGTIDVEVPVSDLPSPAKAPENADYIKTISFRIFYPAAKNATGKKIPWLPNPQRSHLVGYTKFLGIGPMLAEFVSFLPRHLHYATIPVLKNADLHRPPPPPSASAPAPAPASPSISSSSSDAESSTSSHQHEPRWPTMIFSHGLGGSRNAYSHVAGSIASHGVVVLCPEHRDGSSVVSFIRDPDTIPSFFSRRSAGRTALAYRRIPHDETPDVWAQRDDQLRIRCWELGVLHSALLALDRGEELRNLNASTPDVNLEHFRDSLDIHRPGSLLFAGHSFGSATVVQFLKSTFYHAHPSVKAMKHPLFTPDPESELVRQITPKSVTILLDMWCFPLTSPSTPELFTLPLPAYASIPSCPAPGGSAILAISSETFYVWTEHLHTTARILSPSPSSRTVSSADFESEDGVRLTEPHFFYVGNSAHLNQSDFGVLFPWLTKKVFGAESPERALRLNQRCIMQVLRVNGVGVAKTWVGDLVEGCDRVDKNGVVPSGTTAAKGVHSGVEGGREVIDTDGAIIQRTESGGVDFWHWIDVVGLGGESRLGLGGDTSGSDKGAPVKPVVGEHEMEGELEPSLAICEGTATVATAH